MRVNIKRALRKIGKIDFFQPLIESIINSFTANSSEIKINFNRDANQNILGYTIKDNGDGFTKENINSFLELWGEYNIKAYALGSGRLLCIKVFEEMIIKSQIKDNQGTIGKLVNINFNEEFNADYLEEIDRKDLSSPDNWTEVTFKNKRNKNEIITLNNNEVKDKLFISLLPLFISFNKNYKDFSIEFDGNLWINKEQLILEINDREFQEEKFKIKEQEFTLTYRIKKDGNNKIEQFYAAANRKVKNFPEKKVKIKELPEKSSAVFCLTADYFQNKINDDRNDFTFTNTHNPTQEFPILLGDINQALNKALNNVVKTHFSEIEKRLEQRKNKAIENYPFLSNYISEEDKLTITDSEIIKVALNRYQKNKEEKKQQAKKFLTKITGDIQNFNHDTFKEIQGDFNAVGKEMLADYIGYRETIIQTLLTMDPNHREADIHNLFMQQYRDSHEVSTHANNIWIFDDKFMSFNYAASDKTIKHIVKNLSGESQIDEDDKNQRVDLILSYSAPEEGFKDICLVEFKKITPGDPDGKFKAIRQLKQYPGILRDYDNKIRSIFAYTVLHLDEKFRKELLRTEGFKANAFGDDETVSWFYDYNETVNAHLNVLSFDQVLQDAHKRNNVFLNILKNKTT